MICGTLSGPSCPFGKHSVHGAWVFPSACRVPAGGAVPHCSQLARVWLCGYACDSGGLFTFVIWIFFQPQVPQLVPVRAMASSSFFLKEF